MVVAGCGMVDDAHVSSLDQKFGDILCLMNSLLNGSCGQRKLQLGVSLIDQGRGILLYYLLQCLLVLLCIVEADIEIDQHNHKNCFEAGFCTIS